MSGVVYHQLTSPVPDATGTLTVGLFPNTSTVAATDVVNPSDWNDPHIMAQGLLGNTAGVSSVSGSNIAWAGGNNITLSASQDGSSATISIIGAAGGGGGGSLNISAGTTSNNLTNVVFSNSNNVSFGLNGSTLTATVASSLTNINFSAGTTSNNLSALVFSNSNGMSFGLNGSTVTGSYTVPTVTNSSWTVSDAASSASVARLAFTNLNGVTLSLSTGANGSHTIVGSHNGLTSQSNQAFSAAGGSSAFQTLSFSDNAHLSFTNTNGAVAAQPIRASLFAVSNTTQSSSGTQNVSALSFQGNGLVSVGISNGSVVLSATQTAPAVSNAIQSVGSATGSGTNTSRFAADDHVHAGVFSIGVSNLGNTQGDTRVDVGRFVFVGGANITLSQGTAANALNTITIIGGAGGGGGITNINVSAGTTSNNLSNIVFSDSNGLAFGLNGSTITGSYTVPTVTNSSWTVSDAASSATVARLAFTNLNGVTLSLSTGANGSHTIVGSHNALTSQSNQNITAGNGGFAFQTLSFADANGITWSTAAGSAIQASYSQSTHGHSLSLFAVSNTTQSSSGTQNVANVSFQGNGIISVGVSNGSIVLSATQSNQAFSAGGGSSAFQTLGFSDNAYASWTNTNGSVALTELRASFFAASNTTQSSSGTQNLDAVTFAGAGIASVGVTNGSVVVSVPAGGGAGDGGVFAGVSNLGNTAGSTGTVSTGNFVLVGSNGITLSQSTAAAGSHATVTILGSPPATLSYYRHPIVTNSAVATAQGSYAVPFVLPQHCSFSYFRFMGSFTTQSTTIATTAASLSASAEAYTTFNVVIYSHGTGANSLSLQSVASGSAGWTVRNSISVAANGTQYSVTQAVSGNALGAGTTRTTQYSISNTNYSLTTNQIFTEWSGPRYIDIPLAASFTPGNYFAVFGMTTSSATNSTGFSAATACRVFLSNVYGASNTSTVIGVMGSTNFTSGGWAMGAGSFSTAGNGTTNSIPLSAISTLAANFVPAFNMIRQA